MLKVNILEINLRKSGRHHELLRDIYFYINLGSIYCISGKNGTGKTTLLKAITNLLDERFFEVLGEVYFKGSNILSMPDDQLAPLRRNYVKYLFQDPVSSFNPLKKLKYYFDNPDINKTQLQDYADTFMLPGLKELERLHSYELSGGMAQRLALALALSANPVLLILDEPNSGIDYALSNLVSDILRDYVKKKNSSVLMVTQDISFAEHSSDYFGILQQGTFSGFHETEKIFNHTESDTELSSFLTAYNSI
jgi:ABC-type glutathione transport system ATPase component